MDDDDLRDILGVSSAYQMEEEEIVEDIQPARIEPVGDGRILGMTAVQRVAIAAMLFLLTCLVGSLMLVLADKMTIPF